MAFSEGSVDKISSLVIVLQKVLPQRVRAQRTKRDLSSWVVGEGKWREEGAGMRKRRNSFKYLESAIVFPPLPFPELRFYFF